MAIVVIIAVTIFPAAILILQNTLTTLKPSDYQISVREITLEDVTVDKEREIATYIDPDGPDYIIKDNGEKVRQYLQSALKLMILIITNSLPPAMYMKSF